MSGLRYLFQRGTDARRRRVMHIAKLDRATGKPTMRPLCSTTIPGGFDTTINAPFGLGRPVCKRCTAILLRDGSDQ